MGLCRIAGALCCTSMGDRAVWVGGGTAVFMGTCGLQSVGPIEKGGPNWGARGGCVGSEGGTRGSGRGTWRSEGGTRGSEGGIRGSEGGTRGREGGPRGREGGPRGGKACMVCWGGKIGKPCGSPLICGPGAILERPRVWGIVGEDSRPGAIFRFMSNKTENKKELWCYNIQDKGEWFTARGIIHFQCWGKLLLKVMHYNITLLPKKSI